jgi:hypothetical protein
LYETVNYIESCAASNLQKKKKIWKLNWHTFFQETHFIFILLLFWIVDVFVKPSFVFVCFCYFWHQSTAKPGNNNDHFFSSIRKYLFSNRYVSKHQNN